MRLLKFSISIVLLVGLCNCVGEVTLKKEIVGRNEVYILENSYLRLVITLELGGRGEKLEYKRAGKNLTRALSPTEVPGGSGLFIDRFWGTGQIREFEKQPYKVESVENSSTSCSIKLSSLCNNLKVQKTITLVEGCSSVAIDYCITNEGVENYIGKFWVVNSIFPGDSPKSINFFYPYGKYTSDNTSGGEKQITRISYIPGEKPKNYNNFINDPIRSWGAVSSEEQIGAAFEIEYPYFGSFYSWQPDTIMSAPIPTFEWLYTLMELPPISKGKEEAILHPELADPLQSYIFRTGWKLIPFSALPTVDGVAEGIVGSIVVEDNEVKISLISERERELEIELSRCKLPFTEKEELDKRDLSFIPDKTETFSLTVGHKDKGTYVYQLTLKEKKDKRVIDVFEVPYVYKEEDVKYTSTLGPKEEKSHLFEPELDAVPLGTDFPTDCIKWAKPLSKPIKALIISSVMGHQEIGELLRRVDIDLTLVEVCYPHVFRAGLTDIRTQYFGWKVPDPEKALKKALEKEYDVIILSGSLYWSIIPEDLRDGLLEKVKKGAGLIYIHPMETKGTELEKILQSPEIKIDTDFLTFGIPFPVIPVLKEFNPATTVYSFRQYEEGKVIFIHYNPTPNGKIWRDIRSLTPAIYDYSNYLFPYWEYYYSFLGKCILFVSNNEPDITFSALNYNNDKNNLQIKIRNKRDKEKVQVDIEVFNNKWEKEQENSQEIEILPGENEINYPIKALDLAGVHFFNIIVKKGDKVQNWATTWTDVVHPVCLREVQLNKFSYLEKEPIRGEFVIENKSNESLDNYSLHYWITDMHNRLLTEKTMKLQSDKITDNLIEFKENLIILSLSTLCQLEVELQNKNRVIDYKKQYFTVKMPEEKDVKSLIWELDHNWTEQLCLKRMREIGFDWVIGQSCNGSMHKDEFFSTGIDILKANLECSPINLQRLSCNKLEGVIRKPCLTDPVYLETIEKDIKEGILSTNMFYPPAYFLGDELSLGYYSAPHDFCQSPTCLNQFRKYLQEKYISIENLNNIWNTSFKTWEEVYPYTYSQAKEKGNFVPWAEHRLFMFNVFANTFGYMKKIQQEVEPEGKLAVSGMGVPSVYNGFDWYLLSNHLDYIAAYIGQSGVVDMLRSFKKERSLLGACVGYGIPYERTREQIWHQVLNQFFNPAYWWAGYLFNHGDYTLTQVAKDYKKIIDEIKGSGIGKILVESDWVPAEIGIHQSTPSLVVSNITGNYNFINENTFANNLRGWTEMIRDMGFQPPTFLSRYQIEEGILSPEKYPIFVLPLSQSLTDKEIQKIISYVKKGGILIADVRAGIFKENGYLRDENPLNEVFGIYSPNSQTIEKIPNCIEVLIDNKKEPLPISPVEDISLKDGRCLGSSIKESKTVPVEFGKLKIQSKTTEGQKVPALVINKYGKGYGIYLNFVFSEYPDIRKRGVSSKKITDALMKALKKTNFQPQIKVDLPVGSEMVRYKDGDNLYLCLRRGLDFTKEKNDVRIDIPEERDIYEIGNKKYLGRTKTISTFLFPGEVKIFALLPYRRKTINMDTELTSSGEIVYKINIINNSNKRGSGVVKLETYCDGNLKEYYSKNLKITEDGYGGKIPIAMNERNGTWKLKVIDVITGKEYESEVSFKK